MRYSLTVAKTRPCRCGEARVAGSPAMIDSRFSWVIASRASSRKLIRDVDARAVRQHDRDPARLSVADARGGRGDLIVDVEVDDAGRHGQTFIARSTRRKGGVRASSVVWSSIAW